jgi:EAL domain-containing protein (putative c-di-GMP-specific phosphodiesterase class I)
MTRAPGAAYSFQMHPSVADAQKYRESLLGGGLQMLMQPVVDLRTGEIRRFEALARLAKGNGVTSLPGTFLPLLDDSDVDLLFRAGLEQVLGIMQQWDAMGIVLDVSINIASTTLRDLHCTEWVADTLTQHGLTPDRLQIELLETGLMDHPEQYKAFTQLRELGIGFAMDDFGSGHSTIDRLHDLPFETVKIDRKMLLQLRTTPVSTMASLLAIVRSGLDLGCDVVGEGIEDLALAEAIAVLGVPYGQGYFIARPMPADAVPAWVKANWSSPARPEGISTFLGALAYHWLRHEARTPHEGDLYTCPVTAVIDGDPAAGTSVAEWHALQHGATADIDSGALLTEWLADRSQAPGGHRRA